MSLQRPIEKFAAEIAALVHSDQKQDAALRVADFCRIKLKLDPEDNPAKYLPVLQNWLHWLLNNGGTVEAAQLLWTPNQFNPNPQYTRDVWKLYDDAALGLVMGGASCSKSFGLGLRLYMEYLRDPEYTSVKVVGPSQDHLEANLFSDLVGLHSSASLPTPGTVGELFIGMSRRNQLGSIKGLVIPVGQTKKAGRLQGGKRKRRPRVHPIFGALTRLYIFIDEIENVPGGIWSDVDNILSQVEEEGGQGFKIFGAYNPKDMASEVAKRAEPVFGWENLNADVHFRWESRRGWQVLRLDGERCENVVQNKEVYPGLQTRAGLEVIAKNGGGRDSAGYATMGRGMYPVQGVSTCVIPPGMFPKWRGEFIWFEDPAPVASCDLALKGGAAASYTLGKWGKASGMKLPPNVENPKGRIIMFKDKMGRVQPRYGLQADQQFALPKGDSVEMARRLIEINKKAGVKPKFFCCDRTGHGAGTTDIMIHEWGPELHGVNYSEAPSEGKLMAEDSKTCADEYDRLNSELWFATRCFGEYGYLLISPALEATELSQQLTNRLVKTAGIKSRVESKDDYTGRGFKSPDEADSLTLFVHAARKGSGVILSRLGESLDEDGDDGEWWDGHTQQRIDESNRTDWL